ncbi:MAG TPA: DinB family protein [Candidatus Dormibacteraeota bacterium]|nr:DinB family protein [Candidatus Dormibacteraeota bacterium]
MAETSDPATHDRNAGAIEYQQWEISLIGERDPAEVQAKLPAQVRRLIESAGASVAQRPSPDAWSAAEVLAHLVDTEIIYSARYRYIVAHEDPPLPGYDPELLIARLHPRIDEENLADLLATLTVLRAANVALWNRLSIAERHRVGVHAERGRETIDTAFRQVAGHGLLHLEQMRDALAAAV